LTSPTGDSIISLMQMINRRIFLFLSFFSLSALFIAGCTGDEEIPLATEAPTEVPVSPSIELVPTEIPCNLELPGPSEWNIAICEVFDDNAHGWQVESQNNEIATYTSAVTAGEFAVDYFASGFAGYQKTALTWFNVASSSDFAMSIDGRIDSDSNTVSWGVAFRAGEDMGSFFLLSIYVDNSYAFEIFEDKAWISLISRRPFEGPARGEINTLGITTDGGSFKFTINGSPLDEFNSTALKEQNIMLVVSAFEGARANFAFDNLVLQTK